MATETRTAGCCGCGGCICLSCPEGVMRCDIFVTLSGFLDVPFFGGGGSYPTSLINGSYPLSLHSDNSWSTDNITFSPGYSFSFSIGCNQNATGKIFAQILVIDHTQSGPCADQLAFSWSADTDLGLVGTPCTVSPDIVFTNWTTGAGSSGCSFAGPSGSQAANSSGATAEVTA